MRIHMFTLYENAQPMECASVMLEALRGELERAGRIKEARTLKGLEITSPVSLQFAISVVRELKLHGELADIRQYATEAMEYGLKCALPKAS